MLDTKERREFLQKVAAVGESAQVAPARVKIATLVVRKGRTDQREYTLNDKLTVVGKSAMATVKLKGLVRAQGCRADQSPRGQFVLHRRSGQDSEREWPSGVARDEALERRHYRSFRHSARICVSRLGTAGEGSEFLIGLAASFPKGQIFCDESGEKPVRHLPGSDLRRRY